MERKLSIIYISLPFLTFSISFDFNLCKKILSFTFDIHYTKEIQTYILMSCMLEILITLDHIHTNDMQTDYFM